MVTFGRSSSAAAIVAPPAGGGGLDSTIEVVDSVEAGDGVATWAAGVAVAGSGARTSDDVRRSRVTTSAPASATTPAATATGTATLRFGMPGSVTENGAAV